MQPGGRNCGKPWSEWRREDDMVRDNECKPSDKLTLEDIQSAPVWEFVRDQEEVLPDETYVKPVTDIPVSHLFDRLVGTKVRLNNGGECWAILGEIDLLSRQYTEQFLTLGIWNEREWVWKARYFDPRYDEYGAEQLAASLNLRVCDVFPIAYDISSVVAGEPEMARGSIPAEPATKLALEDRLRLVPSYLREFQ